MPIELTERFWRHVEIGDWQDCWPWTGDHNQFGYGSFNLVTSPVNRRRVVAHRMAYELLVGPIPDGLELDHVKAWGCTDTLCCNPLHLEPVTPRENSHRSMSVSGINAAKTHCDNGHEFTGSNTYFWRGRRLCRTCRRARDLQWRQRQ